MLYLDTSLLVTVSIPEPTSASMQDWLAAQDLERLAISGWVVTEFSAALSMKLRMNLISPEQRARALNLFNRMVTGSLTLLPVTQAHFTLAARFADQADSDLRAGDALHLAIAAEAGAVLCTRDRKLLEAAINCGIPGLHP